MVSARRNKLGLMIQNETINVTGNNLQCAALWTRRVRVTVTAVTYPDGTMVGYAPDAIERLTSRPAAMHPGCGTALMGTSQALTLAMVRNTSRKKISTNCSRHAYGNKVRCCATSVKAVARTRTPTSPT